MHFLNLAVTIIIPVFMLVLLGAIARRLQLIDAGGFKGLTSFVFNFAIPFSLFANLAGTSAANRAQLYQNYGQGLASAYTGQGAAQGQGLLSLAQNANAYGNALAATPSAGSQLINLGMTAYGAGMFGTGNQMPANTGMNYPVPAVMMRQFTNPYGIGY